MESLRNDKREGANYSCYISINETSKLENLGILMIVLLSIYLSNILVSLNYFCLYVPEYETVKHQFFFSIGDGNL